MELRSVGAHGHALMLTCTRCQAGVAFFHPDWTFEELPPLDPTNFERRAP